MALLNARFQQIFYLFLGVVVVGAIVWVMTPSNNDALKSPDSLADTTEGNKAELGPSAVQVDALTQGLEGDGNLLIELNWQGNMEVPTPQVKRGGQMLGRVLGDGGIPIPFSSIEIWSGPQKGQRVECDLDGNYRFDGLLPGVHLFRVTAGSFEVGRLQRILSKGSTKRDFIVASSTSLKLKLLGFEKKGIPSASVSVDLGIIQAETDEDGMVDLHGIPRSPRVVLDINAEGYASTRHELNLMPQNPGVPVELGPLPRGGKLRGEIKSWPGGPVPQISIVARALRPASWSYQWEKWQNIDVEENGHFKFTDLPSDVTVDVRAEHAIGIASPVVRPVRPGEYSPSSASFVIKGQPQVLGGIVRDQNGTPVSGAEVRLEAEDPLAVLAAIYPGLRTKAPAIQLPTPASMRRTYQTGRDGRFKFSWADHPKGSGPLLLSAQKSGFFSNTNVVNNARSDFAISMHEITHDGEIQIECATQLPACEWWVNNHRQPESGDKLSGLASGFYSLKISRGALVLLEQDGIHLKQGTRVELR